MSNLDRAISEFRRDQNIDTIIGYLGDGSGSGDPRLRDSSGRMWVRTILAGRYSPPVALPLDTNANIPPKDNLQVEIGMLNGEQTILKATRRGFIQSGLNPGVTNAADPQVTVGEVGSTQFWCKRSADSAKPWTVVVESGYLEIDGEALLFVESEIDLTSFVPSAGEKCIACIYLQPDLTLAAYASTPVLMSDPIIPAYIDECRQQAAPEDISIWGWQLEGDAIGLSENPSKNINLQANINVPQTGSTATFLLEYHPSADIASAVALSATTWTDLHANQNFTVVDASDSVEIAVSGAAYIGTTAGLVSARIVIDSGGTPIERVISGSYVPGSGQANALAGAGAIKVTGLSAAVHTIKVQVWSENANTLNCQPASEPDTDSLTILIKEYGA